MSWIVFIQVNYSELLQLAKGWSNFIFDCGIIWRLLMSEAVNEDAYISLTDIAKYKNPDNMPYIFVEDKNWRWYNQIDGFMKPENQEL